MSELFSRVDKHPILTISRLTKVFGNLVAVNQLDLEVRRGDVFGFLGPNGSGKTTTIRMLLGLIRPTSGHIQLFGMDPATHRSSLLPRIGAIIETPVFYPYLTGHDNLRVVAACSHMQTGKANERRISEVLDLVGLGSRGNDVYRKYSLGMKQRLGIAAALLADPELVLLDEPTNGLDPQGVHEIRQLIRSLSELGKTIFLSNHILSEIQQVCNRVAILQKGKLLKQGSIDAFLGQGNHLIVRLSTLAETEQALHLLQQASLNGQTWITYIEKATDTQGMPALRIGCPATHAARITALLAHHQLFLAELSSHQGSLEAFYLEVTRQATETRPGLTGLADNASQISYSRTPELISNRKRGKA